MDSKKRLGKHTRLFYNGKPTKIEVSDEADNQLDLGHILLTNTGKKLARILHQLMEFKRRSVLN